jgi:hypothetical protein
VASSSVRRVVGALLGRHDIVEIHEVRKSSASGAREQDDLSGIVSQGTLKPRGLSMSVASFPIKAALAAALVIGGSALTSAQAQKFGGHGFGGGFAGRSFGGGGFSRGFGGGGFTRPAFSGGGFNRGFAGAGFARPAFGGGFARPAFGGAGFAQRNFGRGGLITGRSIGFAPRAAFGPRFGFRHRFVRRGFGFGVPLALAGFGLGYGLGAYDYGYDYPYDYGYDACYLRRSWWGGYPHLVRVCPVW